MYSEQRTLLRGILIAFIGLFVVAAPMENARSSPIDIEIRAPRTKLDPLDLIHSTYYGSGVVINKDTILTAFHNIEWPVKGAGTWATGVKVLVYQPEKDICVIKYPTEGLKYSRLAPNQPKVGDRVSLIARHGTYYGIWATNPYFDDQMSVDFDGKRPKIGDSGGGVYTEGGLVGIFLGYNGWIDGPKGEFARIASWATLKAFGIPVSAHVEPKPTELLPLPGTEDVQAPPEGRDPTKEVQPETTAEEPKKEVNHVTRRTTPGSRETNEEHNHTGTANREPERRGSGSINNGEQGRGSRNETSGHLKQGTVPPTVGLSTSQGTSLPPTPTGGRSSIGDVDMLETLIMAALGAAGIGVTGGTAAGIWFGVKGAVALYRRRKKRPDTGINTLKEQIEEVLGRKAGGFPHIPGRNVDEIGAILQLAELEGYDPLMGSTFGLFMQDEINQLLSRPEISEEQKDIVRKIYNSTMDRLNSAAPLVKGQ